MDSEKRDIDKYSQWETYFRIFPSVDIGGGVHRPTIPIIRNDYRIKVTHITFYYPGAVGIICTVYIAIMGTEFMLNLSPLIMNVSYTINNLNLLLTEGVNLPCHVFVIGAPTAAQMHIAGSIQHKRRK